MALNVVSFVFGYYQGVQGWTEKWYQQKTSSVLKDYYPAAAALVNLRIKLSGEQTFAQFVRISDEDIQHDALLNRWDPGTVHGTTGQQSDDVNTCADLKFNDVTNSYSKLLFLRGVWDSIVINGGHYANTDPWRTYFNDYVTQLVLGQFGWLAANRPPARAKILGITQLAGGNIRIQVAPNSFPPEVINKKLAIRAANINTPGNVNGTLVVIPTDADTCESVKRIAMLPYTFGGYITWVTKAFKGVFEGKVAKIGTHNTGRPTLATVGRAKNRVRA